MTLEFQLRKRLETTFSPALLNIENQSHLHKGHAGVQDVKSSETHFKITIDSDKLKPLSRLQAHRMILDSLGDLPSLIHSLSFDVRR